ncbi:MAG: UDP-N-acetylmuramoyl-tripeptide--D-alanyl-D-alanine ligase [Planctomycetes bacterium]|nr:UDP-N-acetylmuramoyl-tripeptide--D-alanyl-D-alanine ligase [Planctomycetota bacterium]
MPSLRLTQVVAATGGRLALPAVDRDLEGVATDTRQITPQSLFVALRGAHFDAHDFLEAAAGGGARAALIDRPLPPERIAALDALGLAQIEVDDTRRALGRLARWHALRSPARRVAVTGSNGKTTTKDLLRAALAVGGETVASEKSFNNDVGLPLTLLSIRATTCFAALEIGTNRPGEIAALADLARPEVAIVTNCGHSHVEFLGDFDGVVREKGALVEALPAHGVAVLNADDPAVLQLRARTCARVVTFGIRRPADFRAVDIRFDLRRLVYELRGLRVYVPLGGCHNVYNSLAALAAADALGVPLHDAIAALRRVEGPPMRMRPRRLDGVTLLDDTYNANPGSVEAAFRTLAALPPGGRRVVVLGDMLELGAQSAQLHQKCGELMSLLPEALLVAVGKHAHDVAAGALRRGLPAERIVTCADGAAAAALVPPLLVRGDLVLVKGSRGMAMEQVVRAITLAFAPPMAQAAGVSHGGR